MTLFDDIGGEESVNAAISIFYDRVLDDESLAPFFSNVDMATQSRKQAAFFSALLSGESQNIAKYMALAHEKPVAQGMTDAHFDRVAKHLQDTLNELKVPQHLVEQIMSAAASLRDPVMGRLEEKTSAAA